MSTETLKERVLFTIKAQGVTGATDAELESHLSARHQSVSARRRELVLSGFVTPLLDPESGAVIRRKSSGSWSTVWVAISYSHTINIPVFPGRPSSLPKKLCVSIPVPNAFEIKKALFGMRTEPSSSDETKELITWLSWMANGGRIR